MAKTTQDYSATAASNTALIAPDGTQIPLGEGQTLPKHVNDALRALMADTAIAAKFSGLPAGRSIALTVKLVSNTDTLGSFPAVGGQKLELDGAVNPALVLAGTTAAPHTYTFDTSDSSMTGALRFYEDASQTTEYTTGVTVSSGQTTIAVTDTTPGVLYYQLAGSAGLGGIAYVIGTSAGGGGGLSSVVQDTTPELGGDLDLNSSNVTGTGNINITGTITATGSGSFANVTVTGTVDGRDVSADGAKLDGIETGATADQTGAEIKTAYEGEANTNAFTDAEKTKLAGIEASATGDLTGAEIKSLYEAETNAFTDAQFTKLAGIETGATADQSDAEIKTAYENNANTNAFTDAEKTKLSGIETGATADQTGAEIKSLYEAETNAFTDAQFTKLAGIETGATADQSDAEIKTAYENNANTNAFTDAEKTKLSGVESNATADQTGAEIKSLYEAETNAFTDAQFTKLAGIETGATADQTGAEIKSLYEAETNAFTDAQFTKLAGIETGATADQSDAEIKTAYENNTNTNAFTDAEKTKLSGIETGATADQTGAEIKSLYEAETNAFTDAQFTKLAGIETNADVTDTANVTAAGALMDSEVTNLAQVKAFDSADYATAAQGATADTAVQPNDSPTFGTVTADGLTVDGSGGGNRSIELGAGRTADGNTLLDFVTDTTYTDYGMRLVRFGGANSASQLIHRGTGVFTFRAVDGGGVQFKTGSAGPGGADTLNMFVTASGDIRFYEDDGTTQGLTWDASTGRLGVGTTNPASTLDVDGEIRSVGVNLAQGNAGVVDARFAFNQDGTQVGWIGAPQWDSDGLYIYGPTASSSTEPVLKYSASQLELRTSNTNRLVIDSSGNVGIGTAPTGGYRFEVKNDGDTNAPLQIWYAAMTNGTRNAAFKGPEGGASASHSANPFVWDTGNAWEWRTDNREAFGIDKDRDVLFYKDAGGSATEGARWDHSSGNFGIGTSSPNFLLDVEGASNSTYLRVGGDDTNNDRGLRFTSSASASFNGAVHTINAPSSQGEIAFATGSAEALRIDDTGNVGIGTSAPHELLEIVDRAPILQIRDTNTGIADNKATLRLAESGSGGSTDNYYDLALENGNFVLNYGTANRVKIDRITGNVGIGTTGPTELLDVDHDAIRLRQSQTPASATATGQQGEICWDSNYVYVCVATNTWKRSALSTW